jgi:hypothetical protein
VFTTREYIAWRNAPTEADALEVVLRAVRRPEECGGYGWRRVSPDAVYGCEEWEPEPECWEEPPTWIDDMPEPNEEA